MSQLGQKNEKLLEGLGYEEYRDIELLRKLGYCEKNLALLHLFYDLVEEVEWCMKQSYSDETIRKLLDNKESFIYVELKMYHDVGLNRISDYITKVYRERQISECDVEVYTNVFGNNVNPSLNDTIISIAAYKCREKEDVSVEYSKLCSPLKRKVKTKERHPIIVPSTATAATVNM
ncbi:MAG: hypothetical protein HFJ12_06800 [Bacilli bacterium]|nr:hypothetical protein [Bacilli bacterium]